MTETVEVSINSKFELVDKVSSLTRSVTAKATFDDDASEWIDLAVREAVINAIKHGNKNFEAKPVDVKFVVEDGQLTVYVRDRGQGFDPSQLPDCLDPQNLLNPAGRGIFFMRTFMDEVEYSTHPEGGVVVRMSKRKQTEREKES
ncbi:MAG TPA: ATP-binding protein [Chthoniobacterales bacterium]|jgi:serine/threonine-protein kinase RsbW